MDFSEPSTEVQGRGRVHRDTAPTIRCICQLGWRDTLNAWSEPQPPHKVQTSVAFLFVPRCRRRSGSAHGPTNMSGCVAMALAKNLHHSRHEVEGGEHDGPRAQKTARATGARPGVLMEPSCREGQPRSVTWLPRGLSWWWRRWLAATALTPPRLLPPLCCAREEGRKRRRGSGRRSRRPLGSESVMACRCPRRKRKKRRCAEWARVPLSLPSVDDRPKMLDIMAGGEQKNNSVLLTCKVGFPGCSAPAVFPSLSSSRHARWCVCKTVWRYDMPSCSRQFRKLPLFSFNKVLMDDAFPLAQQFVGMPAVVQRQVLVTMCRKLRSPAITVRRPVHGEAREDFKVQFMDTVVFMLKLPLRIKRAETQSIVLSRRILRWIF